MGTAGPRRALEDNSNARRPGRRRSAGGPGPDGGPPGQTTPGPATTARPAGPKRQSRRGAPRPGATRPGARHSGPVPEPLPDRAAGVQIIGDQPGLEKLVSDLRAAGEFALDTEFIPENRLLPELGLIQVAAAGIEAVVDPLAVKELDPLYSLVSDPGVLKVVHSGKHDFEIFYGLASVVPQNVFDTQVAAAVIGHGKKTQIALRTLVAGFVGRELSKQEQMSNWLRRPLTDRQVEYAIADVRYLLPLRAKLTERAKALRRLDWLREEMAPLSEESSYRMPPVEECYRSFDGPGFTPSQRGSLRELAAWRERRARNSNRPRGWILKDGALRDLARRQPRNQEQLLAPYESTSGRPPKGDAKTIAQTRGVLTKNPDPILRAISEGARKPIPFTGTGKRERRPAPESLALLLETWLKLRASEHGVAPELLATQEELRAIVAAYPKEPPDARPLKGYRRQILGEDLLLILSGQAVIQVGANGGAGDGQPPIRLARLGRLGRFMLRESRG